MNIVIAHLYYDLLNLYGESGNVKILKKVLEEQKIKVTIKFVTINEEINCKDYDFIYIGSGTESNQKIALKHLLKYKVDIKNFIEEGKFILATGNSFEMFGKEIIDADDKLYKGLNIFKFISKEESFRIIGNSLMKCQFIKNPILGFQNRSSVTKNIDSYLFEVIDGTGSNPNTLYEGTTYNNFYGTYIIGPILVRNPDFLKYIMKQLILFKDNDFKFSKITLHFSKKAYTTYMNNNYEN